MYDQRGGAGAVMTFDPSIPTEHIRMERRGCNGLTSPLLKTVGPYSRDIPRHAPRGVLYPSGIGGGDLT